MSKLILASASPRRKSLLSMLGVNFEVRESRADEVSHQTLPAQIVMELAQQKASLVFNDLRDQTDLCVVGADTIVFIDDCVLNKPKDENEAYAMLRQLSGRWHTVYTGVSVIHAKKGEVSSALDYGQTKVKFKALSHDEILSYIATQEPMDKAGAYGVQGKAALFIERIDGCFYNVVGLPLSKLDDMFKAVGFYM